MTDTKLLWAQLALLRRDFREQYPQLSNDQKASYLADIARIESELGFNHYSERETWRERAERLGIIAPDH
jgi:hypothetical protein